MKCPIRLIIKDCASDWAGWTHQQRSGDGIQHTSDIEAIYKLFSQWIEEDHFVMYKSKQFARKAVAGLGVLACAGMAHAAPEGNLSAAQAMEVVTVRGSDLAALQGQSFSDYSVMVVSGDKLAAIPFQFDDVNERGFPYVPGGKLKINGTEGKLDDKDELVFMLKDTGPKASPEMLSAAGKVVSELKLSDGGVTGYAYVVEGNAERSDKVYARYDQKTGLVKTENWSLQLDPNKPLSWSDLKVKTFKEDRSILDTMKLRVRAKLGFIRATINNNMVPNKVIAVKNGPVRSIVEADASISILGIQLLSAAADFVASANSFEVPVLATIPSAASALSDLAIEISLDFHELDGAMVRTALTPQPIISGKKAAQPLKASLKDNWLSGSHPDGFDIGAFFSVTPGVKANLDALYKDAGNGDEPDEPERFKGSHPQVGWAVTDIPTGVDLDLIVKLYFGDNLWKGNDPTAAMKELSTPVKAQVTAL